MSKKIQQDLTKAVSAMIPDDMYERISKGIASDNERTAYKMDNRSKFSYKGLMKVSAACLVCLLGVFGSIYYNNNLMADSIVDIDVNPSVEIVTNKKEKVIDVKAVNDDAIKILDGMQLKNVDLKVAVNAVIGSMVKNGYIIDEKNGILVSVQNDNAQKANEVRNIILTDISSSLKSNNVTASIINQTYQGNSSAKSFGEKNEISFGKAVFILNLAAKDTTLKAEELAKMSIKDIAMVVSEKNIDIRDIVDFDADDSIWENISDTVEDIDESKAKNDAAVSDGKSLITIDRAKEIALAKENASLNDVTFVKAWLDKDDGIYVYEIEFVKGLKEYEYKINAADGTILSVEADEKTDAVSSATKKTDTKQKETVKQGETTKPRDTDKKDMTNAKETTRGQNLAITAQKAKEIALAHAGISAGDAVFNKAELDSDDGTQKYEVEFKVGNTEYEYEIDAQSGKIIKWEKDIED